VKSLNVAEGKQGEFCAGETVKVETSIWSWELNTDIPYVVQALRERDDRSGRCVKAPQERMVRFNPMLLSEPISERVPLRMAMQNINVMASIRSRQHTIRSRISRSIWFWYPERRRVGFSNPTSKHAVSSEVSPSRTSERPPEGELNL
jgi:hypothetical protein